MDCFKGIISQAAKTAGSFLLIMADQLNVPRRPVFGNNPQHHRAALEFSTGFEVNDHSILVSLINTEDSST